MTDTTRYYRYRDLSFRVRTDNPEDQEWLTEFLHPSFCIGEGELPFDIEVTLSQDTGQFESALHRGAEDAYGTREAFALDNSVIRLPVWKGEKDELTLYEKKFLTFFAVSGNRRRVRLLAKTSPCCRVPLMRVLREYAMNHLMLQGGVFLHSSAVAFGDRGLLIVGTRNAGKTSLLTHLLRHASASYIANDRVFVTFDNSALLAHGMPTISTIRSAMLPFFPGLRRQMETATYHHHLTLEECRHRDRSLQPWEDGRFGLTPAQFINLHGAAAQANAKPAALLFPRATHRAGGLDLVGLSPQQAVKRVPEALFGASTLRHAAEIFNVDQTRLPPVEELQQRCARIVAELPCYEVRLGEQSYAGAGDTDRLLRCLLP